MRNHLYSRLLLLSFSVVLAACAPRVVPTERPAPPGYEEPGARLKSRAEYYRFFQARVYVRAEGPKGKINLRAVMLADLPGRLRLEAFNPFGQTVGLLLLDQEHSRLWLPTENVVYTARRPDLLVRFFLGVGISLDTFAYTLIASSSPSTLNDLRFHDESGVLVGTVSIPSTGSSYTWEFLPSPLALSRFKVAEGGSEYTVNYDPPADMRIAETPKKLTFSSSQWRMEVTVNQLAKTSEPQGDAFRAPIPAGTPEVTLDDVK